MDISTDLPGGLYIVATPIGNLEDISLRAIRVLKQADILACEDTRHTRKLLTHFNITEKKLLSYHNFNEAKQSHALVEEIKSGKRVALVSDAGTPSVSDPGFFLIRLINEHNLPIFPIPGPSALTAALSVSPIPINRFHFEGFLPQKKGRQTRLKLLSQIDESLIFYESPHRIVKLCDEILTHMGDRLMMVGRELTKLHEELITDRVSVIRESFSGKTVRGEFVVVVEGKQTFLKKSSQEKPDEDRS